MPFAFCSREQCKLQRGEIEMGAQYKIIALIASLFITFASLVESCADTQTAASASYADVSAAVLAASPGDTVTVPAESATWDSPVTITRGITLQGAGVGNTVITSNITNQNAGIILFAPNSTALTNNEAFRLTGFTFDCANMSNGILLVNSTTTIMNKVRIDHNRILNAGGANAGRCISVSGTIFGVIDSNELDVTSSENGISVYGNAYGNGGYDEWNTLSRNFGDGNNLFIEDNTIIANNTVPDGGHGGRYVCRYNSFSGAARNMVPIMDMHGNQPAGYSMMVNEVYGNSINLGSYGGALVDHRGGQGLIFFNSVPVSGQTVFGKVREEYADSLYPGDSHTPNSFVQHVTNSYYWANYVGSSLIKYDIEQDTSDNSTQNVTPVLAENRDYWQQRTSFTGAVTVDCGGTPLHGDTSTTGGVGCGTLGAMPATCTTGTAYWATDQSCSDLTGMVGTNPATPITGTLYKCTAQNTWTAYYTPYTYPHPLRSGLLPPGRPHLLH
jgi:hypothetical protein